VVFDRGVLVSFLLHCNNCILISFALTLSYFWLFLVVIRDGLFLSF
jgi:hypothetical protein